MNKNVRNIIASTLVAACVAGSGGAMIASNITEKKLQDIPVVTPTPQVIYVTPEPTPMPSPTPTPIITPEPEPTPAPTPKTEYVPIYVTPDYYLYTVQPGDTLGEIANMFKVPVYWVAGVNQIYNPDAIEIGQQIRIPKD